MFKNRESRSVIITSKKPRYFYGWNIVGTTFLAHLSYALHQSSMLGLFMKPLYNDFGWSRSKISIVQTIARVTEAITAPLIGPFIDKYGPRIFMPVGGFIVGLGMLGATQVNAIWQFYLLRGIIVSIGFTLMGSLVTTVAISNWFVKKRGRAIAISRTGVNLSGIVLVPVTVSVLAASNWQTMYVIFAVLTWVVVLVPSTIFMRRRPEDMGLYPDGIYPADNEVKTNNAEANKINQVVESEEHIWTRKEVLKTNSFWLLAFSFGISSIAFQGINISLAPYIQDLNYSDAILAAVLTYRGVITAVAVLFMGFVAEYAHLAPVRVIPSIIQGIGACLFLFAENQILLWLAVTVYGLGFSGVTVIQEVVWANYFGRLSLGMVRSLAFLVAFGFGAAGPVAMNLVFDIVGSYKPAFVVISILFVLTAFLMGIAQPPSKNNSISEKDYNNNNTLLIG